MELPIERYREIGFLLEKTRFLKDTSLYDLIRINENDVRKRVGQMAQETGVPKEEVLAFYQHLILDIELSIKEVTSMVQETTFK